MGNQVCVTDMGLGSRNLKPSRWMTNGFDASASQHPSLRFNILIAEWACEFPMAFEIRNICIKFLLQYSVSVQNSLGMQRICGNRSLLLHIHLYSSFEYSISCFHIRLWALHFRFPLMFGFATRFCWLNRTPSNYNRLRSNCLASPFTLSSS